MEKEIVVPGMRLCALEEDRYSAGRGTYAMHGYIYASIAGNLRLVSKGGKANKSEGDKGSGSSEMVSVEVHSPHEETVVPAVGDIVTVKVLSVNQRFCKMHILCVRESVLKDPFRAQLRKEDVRATEKDKVEMYKCFRPGDVVLARVLSLGEASTGYIVTTAENELGVVLAYSETTGSKMIPVSWTEMQCPKSYAKEFRKIAKVIPESMADMAMS